MPYARIRQPQALHPQMFYFPNHNDYHIHDDDYFDDGDTDEDDKGDIDNDNDG